MPAKPKPKFTVVSNNNFVAAYDSDGDLSLVFNFDPSIDDYPSGLGELLKAAGALVEFRDAPESMYVCELPPKLDKLPRPDFDDFAEIDETDPDEFLMVSDAATWLTRAQAEVLRDKLNEVLE